jgi:glycosyltransferase involved in cell wall biosynthesis
MLNSNQRDPISVIMPYYKAQATVRQSVVSALRAMSREDELVIVDDGSGTSSDEILHEMLRLDSRVKVVRRQENRGGGWTRNEAVDASKHEWIFCLDSDNIIPSNLLDVLFGTAIRAELDIATPSNLIYFLHDSLTPTHLWHLKKGDVKIRDHLLTTFVASASGNYLYTRLSWSRAGGYPTHHGSLDAWGFGLRQVATGSRMSTVPDTYYFHRYGLDSYYVRDDLAKHRSLMATSLLLEFPNSLEKKDIDFLFSRSQRYKWFQSLPQTKLKTIKSNFSGSNENLNVEQQSIWANLLKEIVEGDFEGA